MKESTNKIIVFCRRNNEELEQFQNSFDSIIGDLKDIKIMIIPVKNRFIFCYKKLHRKVVIYKFLYYMGHSVVTIGSLIVPALLSIQYNTGDVTNSSKTYLSGIYWSTWILSLLVTIFNGVLTLFKIDKNYYLYNIYLEKLKSETYQYFSLSGRYTGHHTGENYRERTYVDQLVVYSYVLEKIYMKLVENEFAQIEDTAQDKNGPQKKEQVNSDKQIGLSPTNPLQNRQSPFDSLVEKKTFDKKSDSNSNDNESINSISERTKNEIILSPDIENQIREVVQKFFLKNSSTDEADSEQEVEEKNEQEQDKKKQPHSQNKSNQLQKKQWRY